MQHPAAKAPQDAALPNPALHSTLLASFLTVPRMRLHKHTQAVTFCSRQMAERGYAVKEDNTSSYPHFGSRRTPGALPAPSSQLDSSPPTSVTESTSGTPAAGTYSSIGGAVPAVAGHTAAGNGGSHSPSAQPGVQLTTTGSQRQQ